MKRWLIHKVKHSQLIYSLYYFCGNTLLKLMRIFVKPDESLLLFVSFGGKKFDDSPRAIFEQMLLDKRFKNKKIVWAFLSPEKYVITQGQKVKIDTLKYYYFALKARVWITNNSIERGLSFKGKNTFFYNSWHGSAIKKLGSDIKGSNDGFKSKARNKVDLMAAQGDYDIDIFSKVFSLPRDKFRLTGLPRNDNLYTYSEGYRRELKSRLGLNNNKVVILYAPTYREYEFNNNGVFLRMPININKWEQILGNKFVILFRAHHAVSNYMDIKDNDFIKDMSKYPKLEDLMIASDMLISDYSSIFFDYSIMDKPMLHFCYDFDKYEQERGMYFDIRDFLSGAEDEDNLIELLSNLDYKESTQNTIAFRNKYVTVYGNASKQTLDILAKELRI